MGQTPNERLRDLVERLALDPAMPQQLPGEEGAYVRAALAGQSVHVIAQQHQVSEEAVWRALSNAARLAAGEPVARPVETGGLGSDTDPGVTGGYGDTGFGSLGNEPPEPTPEEPTAPTGLADG
jgi:hypothetical protein